MSQLVDTLKQQIVSQLRLHDVAPESLDANAPLFGGQLGLDSIDALELIMLLEKNYGIRVEDPKEGRKIFESVQTMADFIQNHQRTSAPVASA